MELRNRGPSFSTPNGKGVPPAVQFGSATKPKIPQPWTNPALLEEYAQTEEIERRKALFVSVFSFVIFLLIVLMVNHSSFRFVFATINHQGM
jgi:hypothetical protein